MSHFIGRYDTVRLDVFEDLLPDMPHDQRWELIDGRVIKGMVGAGREHNVSSQNVAFGLASVCAAATRPPACSSRPST